MFDRRSFLVGLIVGICLIVTGLSVWVTWSIRSATATNTRNIAEISAFLNNAIQKGQAQQASQQ